MLLSARSLITFHPLDGIIETIVERESRTFAILSSTNGLASLYSFLTKGSLHCFQLDSKLPPDLKILESIAPVSAAPEFY